MWVSKYDFCQGGEGGLPISDFFWQGGGGLEPPFLADIICKQPLIPYSKFTYIHGALSDGC